MVWKLGGPLPVFLPSRLAKGGAPGSWANLSQFSMHTEGLSGSSLRLPRVLPLPLSHEGCSSRLGVGEQCCPSTSRNHSCPVQGGCSRAGTGQQGTSGANFKKALALRALPALLPPQVFKFCALAFLPASTVAPALPCSSSQHLSRLPRATPGLWAPTQLPYLASALSALAVPSLLAFLPGKKISGALVPGRLAPEC